MSTTTSEFSKLVEECRKNKSSTIIHNASYERAKELFINLFEMAIERKEEVKIVSGDLHADFYESLCEVAKKTMDSGAKIKLVVLNPEIDLSKHPFSKLILEKNNEVFQAIQPVEYLHFILVNNKRFRLELDHKKTKAIASFNNLDIGDVLNALFNKIINLENIKKLPSYLPA